MVKIWIQAFRLRTLPLALACIIVGSFCAMSSHAFSLPVLVLALVTTLFLQILSNLANDYGDAQHGVDNENRLGPLRVTQKGMVSKQQMRTMIAVFVVCAIASGILLIIASFGATHVVEMLLFSLLGISAIVAAIKYTIGKKPYGYAGLGDFFVFIYFGLVGVAGTFFLHTHRFDAWILLPASAIGLLSAGVLNLNNMRDRENDTLSGKKTLVVRMGIQKATRYHASLIVLAILVSVVYTAAHCGSWWRFLFIITVPLFVRHCSIVLSPQTPSAAVFNNELKNLALSTFAFAVMFGLGQAIR